MGHDTHFLERLDRVADAHVERALTLYRDQELLREVLDRAGLAEGVERLAISLDDPREGPFVIVTRAGRFVTCLGKGMRVTKEPTTVVLTRERLDAAASKVERMRERLAQVQQLVQQRGEGVGARAFRKMGEDGLRFCREDAETLLTAMPLISQYVMVTLLDGSDWIRTHRRQVAAIKFDRLKPREERAALEFGRAAWTMAHLMVLLDHDDVQPELKVLREMPGAEMDTGALMAMRVFELGTFAHATRALWFLARRPRDVLRDIKELHRDVERPMRILREFALATTALASTKYRAECVKAMGRLASTRAGEMVVLEAGPEGDAPPRNAKEAIDRYADAIGTFLHLIVEHPEGIRSVGESAGRSLFAALRARGGPVAAEQIAAVPPDVGRAVLGVLPVSLIGPKAGWTVIEQLAVTLPWIAGAAPTELFLPREYASNLTRDSVDDVMLMVPGYVAEHKLSAPKPVQRKTEKLGRNDPCWCGSGQKLKRCCGPGR